MSHKHPPYLQNPPEVVSRELPRKRASTWSQAGVSPRPELCPCLVTRPSSPCWGDKAPESVASPSAPHLERKKAR